MQQEHSPQQIELYITVGDENLSRAIDEELALLDLDKVVKRTLEAVGITRQVMLTLLITDDETIRDMNKQFRQQNEATDVLSFPMLDRPLVNAPADQLWTSPEEVEGREAQEGEKKTPAFVSPPGQVTNLGDVAISWPTLMRQANTAGHNPVYELLYLLVHGILHLVGYDDQTEAGYQAMVHLQQSVLESIGQKA